MKQMKQNLSRRDASPQYPPFRLQRSLAASEQRRGTQRHAGAETHETNLALR
jgi:hypothetical protein